MREGAGFGRSTNCRFQLSAEDAFAPDEVARARCQGSDDAIAQWCVRQLADVIERRCQPLLANETGAFERLDEVNEPLRRAATTYAPLHTVLQKADEAWSAKRWSEALALYQNAEEALSPTQERRLRFLQRRLT